MSDRIGKITGTFLDEITIDIGSLNWSAADWARSFEAMAFIGIDTVIIIRGGLRDLGVFPSKVIGNRHDPDLAQLFLDEAARHGMRLFFGTYDSGMLYLGSRGLSDPKAELDLNRRFADEVFDRYGAHPAFKGWYMTHEVSSNLKGINELYRELAGHLKNQTPMLPILISPYYPSRLIFGDKYLTPEQFGQSWRELLDGLTGLVDIMAFQDGTCRDDYPEYLAVAKTFADDFGIEFWNNVEAFDRNMSYHFPPRDIRQLTRRLRITEPYVTKHITFEFTHFMSPNSEFPGAANLYRRYCETVLGKQSPW
ncbi:MAG: DUF4434 domain-containing protein [bacterium]|nr:DUF4434 domain-containing protein [bacterium]